ncbi:MAG: SseB family protein [Hyphomonadaceae bacterium]|nr:SseB family protein [Hyphomonadaceae bacterium]
MRALLLAAAVMAAGPAVAQDPPAAATEQPASAPAYIEPTNALEQTFVAAVDNPDLRAAFRRQFLESQVALALSSRDPAAPPRAIDLPNGTKACLIFTSPARAAAVMGDDSPYVVLTGREALMLVRGTNVIINVNLRPFLTLDSEAIDSFLSIPHPPAEPAPPTPAPENASAGPTQ